MQKVSQSSSRCRSDHECTLLAANTVHKIYFLYRSAINRAARWRYLSVNAAEITEPPTLECSKPDPPSTAEATSLLSESTR